MSERCLSVFAFGTYQINPNAMESARALQGRAAITKPYFDSAYRLSAMCRATRIPASLEQSCKQRAGERQRR